MPQKQKLSAGDGIRRRAPAQNLRRDWALLAFPPELKPCGQHQDGKGLRARPPGLPQPGLACSSHSSGGWKSRIKVSVGLGPGEASLLGLKTAACPCVPRWPPLCMFVGRERDVVFLPLLIKTPDTGLERHPNNLITCLEALSPNTVILGVI